MADLTITASSVLASASAIVRSGTAGATITAGQPIYIDTADMNKLKLADANASAATAVVAGIALHGASAGQPLKYVVEDASFTPGATLTVGQVYVLSATAGGIAPVADLTTGDRPAVLMVAETSSTAKMKIIAGTAAKP